MKKGILFDLDGTLWDSAKAVADSWNEALEKFTDAPYRTSEEQMYTFMGHTMEEIALRFFDGETRERALELLDVCAEYENDYIAAHGGRLFDGVIETLKELKEAGYFLAIVSNCQLGYIEAFLKYYKLDEYFDDTENYGRTLKDKDVNIRLVVDRNNLDKAVYVGDIMSDYNSTMKAGLPFIHAAYGFGSVPEGTPAIKDIRELKYAADKIMAS